MTTQAEVAVSPLIGKQLDNNGKEIMVLLRPVKNIYESRSVMKYRPVSRYVESRYGGGDHCDDECLLFSGAAQRCKMCMAPTRIEYLISRICPDCDGRSQTTGIDPFKEV